MAAPEASALVEALPDWLKWGANAALFVVALVVGVAGFRKKEGEHADVGEILEASPVVGFFADVKTIAVNLREQTDALRVMSAAASAAAKTFEADFSERRIERAVEERLERREAARRVP